ncbi:hypothetical protein DFH08DRAFT_956320 [Mycena albidolilacea]|uniref:Ribonuclease H1 N-terminal domain-containing protein n=1 Tax=Mycena albidolilacea TaxID=1033008 RepID=A0AAD7EXK4_9AGAR|nr:hypothetical protein DFH08DRAFT_956320 [Mycena albidolilacea]
MADIQTTIATSSPAAELPENTPLTLAEELTALRFKVSSLSKLALDLTRLCIEINDDVPHIVKSHVDAAVAKAAPKFYHSAAPAPDELEALFPPGYGDSITWYVVCVGRRPSLYASFADADDQVRGVPKQSCKKKDSRQEALLYYRAQYDLGECERVSGARPALHVDVEVVTAGP